jgi:hypothetical protein
LPNDRFFISSCAKISLYHNNNQQIELWRLIWDWLALAFADWLWRFPQAVAGCAGKLRTGVRFFSIAPYIKAKTPKEAVKKF